MVNLPPFPFKPIDFDDSHPLVREALRSRKHYEKCWCGSGKKFKYCHRLRTQEPQLPIGQLLDEQSRIFWRQRGCMHPDAGPSICRGKVIDAHSIQRKGPLKRIVDSRNHVCQFAMDSEGLRLTEIGWRKASTFPGYCALHDSVIFDPLERETFSGTHEQCVLQAYRSVCNELYRKRALIDSLKYQRNVIDRGCNLDEQIERQLSVFLNIEGQTRGEEDLESIRIRFDDAVRLGDYSAFSSQCYFFEGEMSVTSASALHTEFDFKGLKLSDMWDLTVEAQILCHSILATEHGGAIVFVWLTDEDCPLAVVASFEAISDTEKGDAFVEYCFLNCENVYFSRSWWEALPSAEQEKIKKYASAIFYEGGPYTANDHSLVNWRITGFKNNGI